MTDLEILARVILALGFGAILGLETETRATEEAGKSKTPRKVQLKKKLGGVRTYTVLALFGALGGLLYEQGHEVFAYLMFISIALIVVAAYVLNVQAQKAFGMTTEIAILMTVLIAFASTAGVISLQVLVILTVILTFILSQKRGVARLTREIAHAELIDVVTFGIVAVVIFPFLPNVDLHLADVQFLSDLLRVFGISDEVLNTIVVLNPFRLWQYVVLISGFNLLGYFANRVLGKKRGLLFTGIFGGFVSSTSTTISLASRSDKEGAQYMNFNLGAAGLIANAVSFLQIMVLAASASLLFFSSILPMSLAMAGGSIFIAAWFMNNTVKDVKETIEVQHQPFSLGPAIKFAILLTGVRLLLQIANTYLGGGAFVFVTALSGMMGMDIATISLGELVYQQEVGLSLALVTFLAANGVNFIAKAFYSQIQGSKRYFKVMAIGLGVSFVAGVIGAGITLLG